MSLIGPTLVQAQDGVTRMALWREKPIKQPNHKVIRAIVWCYPCWDPHPTDNEGSCLAHTHRPLENLVTSYFIRIMEISNIFKSRLKLYMDARQWPLSAALWISQTVN